MGLEADELDFLATLKEEFIDEGLEHIEALEGSALSFEKSQDMDEIKSFKRKLHSFKGSAQAVDEDEFAEALHNLESKLELCIVENRTDDFMALVYPCIDKMREYVSSLDAGGDEQIMNEFKIMVSQFK